MNQALPFLHEGPLEITFTVPLSLSYLHFNLKVMVDEIFKLELNINIYVSLCITFNVFNMVLFHPSEIYKRKAGRNK